VEDWTADPAKASLQLLPFGPDWFSEETVRSQSSESIISAI